MREVVATKDAPQAIGPYSQAIKANGFVFVSGQTPIDPATQQHIDGDVRKQTERVLNNKGVDRLLEIEREKGKSLKIEDIHEQVAGVYPKVMIDGDMDAGAWSCGMVAGLIHDIPTVKELIDRIMADAEQIIRQRLTGFLDGAKVTAKARAVA